MITLSKDGQTIELPAESYAVAKLKAQGWS